MIIFFTFDVRKLTLKLITMKRQLSFFFTAVILSGLAFMTSCSKSSSTTVDQTPTIKFVTINGYVSTDVTLPVNTSFKVGIVATSNTNSGAKLTKLTITRLFGGSSNSQDTVIATSAMTIDIMAKTSTTVGQEKWTYKVTDSKSQTKEISLTITTIVTLEKSTNTDDALRNERRSFITFTEKKD